ncbi:hypothetical protein IWX49DRAFT_260436 [Phyllosticta citricarpa]|uniref:Secreted protein n=1 Tax=Phyllosticta citricarpa TaxID=55181 RepID=A0ABR1LM36_9PEZI
MSIAVVILSALLSYAPLNAPHRAPTISQPSFLAPTLAPPERVLLRILFSSKHHLRLEPGRPAAYRTRRRLLCLHAPPLSRRKFDLALCTPSRNCACTFHLFFQNSYLQKSNHTGS